MKYLRPPFAILFLCAILQLPLGAAAGQGFFSDEPVFRMAMPAGTIQWHPHFYYSSTEAQLFTAVYEGLVAGHPLTQRPVAGAAESWEISADKLVYTFKIRKNARFSNGTPLTAETFRNTWISLLSLGSQAPFGSLLDPVKGARAFRIGSNRNPEALGLQATDPLTLKVTLEQPTAHFLQVLCHQSLVPIEPTWLSRPDWSKAGLPPGNGPFVLVRHDEARIEFNRNDNYWDKANVSLRKIEVDLGDDLASQTTEFNNHKYQWLAGGAQFDQLNNKSAIIITPQFATNFLFFNNRQTGLSNPKVRRGLTLLIDLAKLRDPSSYYVPTARLIPSIPRYPDVKTLTARDAEKGLALLAEAGYPKGKGLGTIKIFLPSGENSQRMADLMKEAWSGLELSVEYVPSEAPNYNDLLNNDSYSIATLGWIGDYADPLTFLDLFSGKGSLNIASYADPAFDELLARSHGEQGSERYKTLAACEELLLQDAACIPLSHSPSINVIDLEQVDGWYENPFDIHPFKALKPKAAKPPRNVALY